MLNEAAVTSHNVYGPVGLSGDLAALQIYLPSPPTPTINMYLKVYGVTPHGTSFEEKPDDEKINAAAIWRYGDDGVLARSP